MKAPRKPSLAGWVAAALCVPVLAWGGAALAAATDVIDGPGDPQALTQLAVRYEHGEGVTKSFPKALELYCTAARLGYAEAQFNLGWMYANGRGVTRDDDMAATLFAAAAEQGNTSAARALQFVHPRAAVLPACMTPPPEPVVEAKVPDAVDPADDAAASDEERRVRKMVRGLAPDFGVDPRLALAIITAESAFNATAVSPKNAQGLMQLIPDTATRFGVRKVLDPVQNVKGGLAYLRWLLAFFEGNVPLVVAAYNAGEHAVEKYRGIPPYLETRNYVKRVTALYRPSTHPFQPAIVDPSPLVAQSRTPAAKPRQGAYAAVRAVAAR